MKKNIFLFAFLVPIMIMNAQTQDFFGVKFGVNASSMSFSNDNTTEKYNSNISYYLGFFGEVKLKNKLYIQPELLYSRIGSNVGSVAFRLHYIQTPVLAKYYITNRFSVDAGPQFGLLASSSVGQNNTPYGSASSQSRNANKFFNSIDLGLNIGLNFNISKTTVINTRYYHGIANIASNTFKNNFNNASQSTLNILNNNFSVNNSTIQVGLGFRF